MDECSIRVNYKINRFITYNLKNINIKFKKNPKYSQMPHLIEIDPKLNSKQTLMASSL